MTINKVAQLILTMTERGATLNELKIAMNYISLLLSVLRGKEEIVELMKKYMPE